MIIGWSWGGGRGSRGGSGVRLSLAGGEKGNKPQGTEGAQRVGGRWRGEALGEVGRKLGGLCAEKVTHCVLEDS